MRALLPLLFSVCLAACQPPEPQPPPPESGPPRFLALDWKPYTVRVPERSAELARIIYRGDLDLTVASGDARVLGTLIVAFPSDGDPNIWMDKIMHSSAKRGGSHAMIIFDEQTEKVEVTVDEVRLQAQKMADAMRHSLAAMQGKREVERQELLDAIRGPAPTPMKAVVHRRRVVAAVVLYVPPEHWAAMPEELRPIQVKKKFSDGD